MRPNLISKIPVWLCSLSTTAIILWLTLSPNPTGDVKLPLFEGADKVVHALMFGFLTWMFHIDLSKLKGGHIKCRSAWLCATVALFIGVLIEWLQDFMSLGRSMEFADLLADGIGAFAVAAIIWAVSCRGRHNRQ